MPTPAPRSPAFPARGRRAPRLAVLGAVEGWLRARLATLKGDLRAVTAELRGERLSPVIRNGRQLPRHGLASADAPVAPPPARPLAPPSAEPSGVVTARVTLGGVTRTLSLRTDQPILAQALAAGVALPFSCQAGGCGACRLRCVSGTVRLPDDHALSPEELAAGDTLTCVGLAACDVTLEAPP